MPHPPFTVKSRKFLIFLLFFWFVAIGSDASKHKNGADERSRTSDLRITNALLYQLSYIGESENSTRTMRPRVPESEIFSCNLVRHDSWHALICLFAKQSLSFGAVTPGPESLFLTGLNFLDGPYLPKAHRGRRDILDSRCQLSCSAPRLLSDFESSCLSPSSVLPSSLVSLSAAWVYRPWSGFC